MARNLNPSLLSFIGHLQGRVNATISSDNSKLVTLGQDDLIIEWNIADMTSRKQIEVNNPNQQIFTCFDYCQQDGVFAMGTQSGNVIIMRQHNTLDTRLVYKSSAPITSLKYSNSLRYLAIGSQEDKAVIYDKTSNRFTRCDKGHDGMITYAAMTYDEQLLVTLGSDGYAYMYTYTQQENMGMNQLQMIAKYRICHKQQIKKYVNYSERPNHPRHLTLGGATTLQQLLPAQGNQFTYQIKVQIHEQTQITNVCWINEHILVVCTQDKLSIWNYTTKNRFHTIKNMSLYPLVTNGSLFMGCDHKGIIYRYENDPLFEVQLQEVNQYLQMINQQQNANNDNNQLEIENEPEVQEQQVRRKVPKKVEVSYAGQLVTKFPQNAFECSYQEHMDLQFMFYNQHGCVIRRTDVVENMMELEYHDKCKIRRNKPEMKTKYFTYFALTDSIFMYSTLSHAFFQMESYHRSKKDDGTHIKIPCISKWQFKLQKQKDTIQNVLVGNTWAAIVCSNQIRIFDFYGNQLYNISTDRMYLASAAYEDMLAIAYHSTVPLAESQVVKVKFYKITNQSFKLERRVLMPIKNEEELKWFGFSQEGCLFNHDTSETVRMYCWDLDEWVNVHVQDKSKFKLYIQHIEDYLIYGFKIQQKEGQHSGPIVLPRSLPRKIFFSLPQQRLKFFTNQENRRLQSIYFRRLSLIHQKFRSRRWYKYKYSRGLDHPLFSLSQKISSEQELIQKTTELDLVTIDQIKKVLPGLEQKLAGQELKQAKMELLSCCSRLVFYPESASKINSLFGFKNPFDQYEDEAQVNFGTEPKKYEQLSGLISMIDLGWIQKQFKKPKMEISR